MPEKRTEDQREESNTQDPEEEPITDDSKTILSLINLKKALSLRTINGFYAPKKSFWLFGDGI